MPNLVIMVGIPGAGKSHFSKHLMNDHEIVETDAIRRELTGDHKNQDVNDQVFPTWYSRINDHLANGKNVIADSTGLDLKTRQELAKIAAANNARTHLVLFKNLHEAKWRNRMRGSEAVPDKAMERMQGKFFDTLSNLPHEQYDTVTQISGFGGQDEMEQAANAIRP